MFGPKIVEGFDSKYSGKIEVRKQGRDIYVVTDGLTQSGGLIYELWEKTLKRLGVQDLRFKTWLILGLATGTVAKLISQKYSPTKIVGVEIDPLMLDIGRKYFDLDNIPNLKIINQDAKCYILDAKERFDVLLVDLYIGDQLPAFVYQIKFLEQLGKLGQLVIVNHLFYDQDKKAQARLLTDRLAKIFPHIQLVRELTNLLIICS